MMQHVRRTSRYLALGLLGLAGVAQGAERPPVRRPESVRVQRGRLDVRCCKLKKLGSKKLSHIAPTDVVVLDCTENLFENLTPAELHRYVQLRVLSLQDNPTLGTRIPGGTFDAMLFQGMRALETINLQGCNLATIPPECFADQHGLKRLLLGNNRLSEWPVIDHCRELRELDLSNNRLAGTLPDLSMLRQLEFLDLHNAAPTGAPDEGGNRVTDLPVARLPHASLILVLADYNQIIVIPWELIDAFVLRNGNDEVNGGALRLEGNPCLDGADARDQIEAHRLPVAGAGAGAGAPTGPRLSCVEGVVRRAVVQQPATISKMNDILFVTTRDALLGAASHADARTPRHALGRMLADRRRLQTLEGIHTDWSEAALAVWDQRVNIATACIIAAEVWAAAAVVAAVSAVVTPVVSAPLVAETVPAATVIAPSATPAAVPVIITPSAVGRIFVSTGAGLWSIYTRASTWVRSTRALAHEVVERVADGGLALSNFLHRMGVERFCFEPTGPFWDHCNGNVGTSEETKRMYKGMALAISLFAVCRHYLAAWTAYADLHSQDFLDDTSLNEVLVRFHENAQVPAAVRTRTEFFMLLDQLLAQNPLAAISSYAPGDLYPGHFAEMAIADDSLLLPGIAPAGFLSQIRDLVVMLARSARVLRTALRDRYIGRAVSPTVWRTAVGAGADGLRDRLQLFREGLLVPFQLHLQWLYRADTRAEPLLAAWYQALEQLRRLIVVTGEKLDELLPAEE